VEDELLDAVSHPETIPDLLMNGSSWPHLYHLSNIRENLLEWYDFNPQGTLLEIGSGCGAITGLFCSRVKEVTAIELSKKRSLINATRNQSYDNLEIMVGNFTDIRLDKKFDYVTLIGVFEYSICYVGGDHPFEEMLARARSFLKPDGTLIIAIENKYGMKYFAGAAEDHTGLTFDGIQNYNGVDRVRTFSKKSITKLLENSGFTNNTFYYPVPDYKLPSEIYSDAHLPSVGSIRQPSFSYDRPRTELFNENLAFDAVCEDGMFPEFANSFLIFSKAE
jgi:precorrin-6B methylase 2